METTASNENSEVTLDSNGEVSIKFKLGFTDTKDPVIKLDCETAFELYKQLGFALSRVYNTKI